MEEVLDIYERDYDPEWPVVCFDERPCQLIDDVVAPVPMKPGRVRRHDYEYRRNGTCVVFIAFEPLTGKRIVETRQRRTKKDYGQFMTRLLQAYPRAQKIILVQDNLNTHNPSSFYEAFSPAHAFRLSQRFQMVQTPNKASWLNMAEIELATLTKQCLDRRIGTMKYLSKEVCTWARDRNRRKATVSWQFTKTVAREKFNRHYYNIRN